MVDRREHFRTWNHKKTQLVLTAHDRRDLITGTSQEQLKWCEGVELSSKNSGELVVIPLRYTSFDRKTSLDDENRKQCLTIRDFEISDSCFYELALDFEWPDFVDDQPADKSDS